MDLVETRTRAELAEWLGLKPADFLVYASLGAATTMFFVHNATWDAVLAAGAALMSVAACPLGMRRDPDVLEFTNVVKLISYIPAVILVVAAVTVHYMFFND